PMADDNKKSGLDRRQRDIKVGAGLEESRYNVEFIDFLRKWGPTAMLVIAAAAMTFWGLQKYRENKEAKTGLAFGDVDQAMGGGATDVNPDVLVRIAEDNEGQGSVPVLARLAAAEQWRSSAMKGYRPGAFDARTRTVLNQDDYLTREGRQEYLEKARQQYQWVVDQTAGNKAKATFTLTGLMGLAAVAETQMKPDEAKAAYTRAQALAEEAGFPEYAALAKTRLETVDKFTAPPVLLPEAMVMSWDKPVAPPALPGSAGSLLGPSALTGDFGAGGTPPMITVPPVVPPSTPTPAPEPVLPGQNPGGSPSAVPPAPAPSPTPAPVPPSPTPAPAGPEQKDEPKQP
ncbi:MAG TPA: hypothetical protein VFF65_08705, partial [Phycisphaerales bacterium]|nr:hypothetical protein [Phycisphaerales bacterium]